jgi:hypothetical protein
LSYGWIIIGLFWLSGGFIELRGDTQRALSSLGAFLSYGGYSEGSSGSMGATVSIRGILRVLFWLFGGFLELRGDTQRALLVLWGPL